MLTPRQKECLDFIVKYMRESGGVSPSMSDITEGLLLENKGNAHRLVIALEERGFIRRMTGRARALEVLRTAPAKRIPVYDAVTLKFVEYLP